MIDAVTLSVLDGRLEEICDEMDAGREETMSAAMQRRDLYAGVLLILVGLGAVIEGRNHSIGSLTHMGAGYFPIVLGVILAGLGAVIGLGSFVNQRRGPP